MSFDEQLLTRLPFAFWLTPPLSDTHSANLLPSLPSQEDHMDIRKCLAEAIGTFWLIIRRLW